MMSGGLVVLFIGGSRAGEEGGGPCCKVTIYHSAMFSLSTHSSAALGEGFASLEISWLEAELFLRISTFPVNTVVLPIITRLLTSLPSPPVMNLHCEG